MGLAEILGLVGVASITIAYFLLNQGKLQADQWFYPAINFLGASLIMYSLFYNWNLSAFLMEFTWAAISLFSAIKLLAKKKS